MKLTEEIIKKQGYKDARYLAKFFGRSDRHIRKLTTDGILKGYMFKGAYYYDLIPTIRAYIMYLTKLAEEKSNILDDLSKEKADAEIMYLRTRAKKAVLEVKEYENKLLPAEAVKDFTNDLISHIRQECTQIPNICIQKILSAKNNDKSNTLTPNEVSEIITDVIYCALNNMSNYSFEYKTEKY